MDKKKDRAIKMGIDDLQKIYSTEELAKGAIKVVESERHQSRAGRHLRRHVCKR